MHILFLDKDNYPRKVQEIIGGNYRTSVMEFDIILSTEQLFSIIKYTISGNRSKHDKVILIGNNSIYKILEVKSVNQKDDDKYILRVIVENVYDIIDSLCDLEIVKEYCQINDQMFCIEEYGDKPDRFLGAVAYIKDILFHFENLKIYYNTKTKKISKTYILTPIKNDDIKDVDFSNVKEILIFISGKNFAKAKNNKVTFGVDLTDNKLIMQIDDTHQHCDWNFRNSPKLGDDTIKKFKDYIDNNDIENFDKLFREVVKHHEIDN